MKRSMDTSFAEMQVRARTEVAQGLKKLIDSMEQPDENRQVPAKVYLEGKIRTIYVTTEQAARRSEQGIYEVTLPGTGRALNVKDVGTAQFVMMALELKAKIESDREAERKALEARQEALGKWISRPWWQRWLYPEAISYVHSPRYTTLSKCLAAECAALCIRIGCGYSL